MLPPSSQQGQVANSYDTLAQRFMERAELNHAGPCLFYKDEALSYGAVSASVRKLAAALREHGVKPGDRVAIFLPDSPNYVISYVAVLLVGAVLVPINVKSKASEIAYILRDSESRYLLIDPAFGAEFADIPDRLEALAGVLQIDAELCGPAPREQITAPTRSYQLGRSTWVRSWSLIAAKSITDNGEECLAYPEDDSILFYTSGTTGKPKGVVCTHQNCLAAIDSWIDALQITEHTRSLMVTPYFHNAFNAFVYAVLLAGGSTVVTGSFQIRTLLNQIQRHKVNFMFGVPSVYIALLNSAKLENYDLSSLATAVYGAAPMPVEVIKQLENTLSCDLYNAYAQSETCPAISVLKPEFAFSKAGSVGRAVNSVDIAILDEEGKSVDSGQIGEICCRGPNIMRGYYGKPEITEQKLRNGWLHTGDLGYIDEDGFLFLVDRKDGLIITKGENVYPGEIEEVLHQYPSISDAAVVGVPDKLKGHVIAAYVVPAPSSDIDLADLRRFCIQKLTQYKVPSYFKIIAAMPRNASGKVLKTELEKIAL